MRYKNIDKELFVANRKRLLKALKPNSLVVVNANDIMPTNADGTMRFRQNSDLFYLTGADQEETIFVLCPDFPDKKYREVLFLRETNERIATWEGHKLTKDEARAATGIETVLWTSEFSSLFNLMMLMGDVVHVYLNTNDHYRADIAVESREMRFVKSCIQKYPLHKYERLAPIMHALRSLKSKPEIELLQRACDITEQGFRRLLKFVKPGVMEYEIEAELRMNSFAMVRAVLPTNRLSLPALIPVSCIILITARPVWVVMCCCWTSEQSMRTTMPISPAQFRLMGGSQSASARFTMRC